MAVPLRLQLQADEMFQTKNGLAEGDWFPLHIALASMHLWTRTDPTQDLSLQTASFIDDSHVHCDFVLEQCCNHCWLPGNVL